MLSSLQNIYYLNHGNKLYSGLELLCMSDEIKNELKMMQRSGANINSFKRMVEILKDQYEKLEYLKKSINNILIEPNNFSRN